MKKLQQLCAATTLLFVLTVSALGGHITTGVADPPPPPQSATVTDPGHITTDATDSTQNLSESDSLVVDITLSLLQLLSVI